MAEETTNKRPTLVSVLCILSFIGSGLGVLFSLLGVIGVGALASFLENVPGLGDALAGSDAGAGIGLIVMNLILNAGTLFGAIMMWKMKKLGFWIYAGSYLLQFILPMILFSGRFSIFGLIIMAAFIVLYGINLKKMD